MNKRVKWGIIIVIGAALIGWGIYTQMPKQNEELAEADKVMTSNNRVKRILNVNATIAKPQTLIDEIPITGSLIPDEEVDLSFETVSFKEIQEQKPSPDFDLHSDTILLMLIPCSFKISIIGINTSGIIFALNTFLFPIT